MVDEPEGLPDAVLRPTDAAQVIDVARLPPGAAVAELVDYHWFVGWDTPEPHRQQVVPQPKVHLVAEDDRLLVYGVTQAPFFRTLVGTGHVLGAAFHPGGFRPLLGRSVRSIAEVVAPAADLLGPDDRAAAATILSTDDRAEMQATMEDYVAALDPQPDPVVVEVRALVDLAESDRSLTRAEDLAARSGMSLRSLQRMFTEYVGIGPKWVISRFRILDVASAAHADAPVRWADLAVELGFSDQAHLIRAFTQVVGTPPATYRRDA